MDISIIRDYFVSNGKKNRLLNLSETTKDMMIEYAKTNKDENLSKLIFESFKIEYKTNKVKRTKTRHVKSLIDEKKATQLFNLFKNGIEFDSGIKDKYKKETRPAKNLEDLFEDDPVVKPYEELIFDVVDKLKMPNMIIVGQYMNYYENGNNYAPNHSHKGLTQIIISLGATRTLEIGKKKFESKNGDVFVFGSSIHGVPKEPHIKNGRISIALFCKIM